MRREYLPSYRYDKKSYMSFRLVPISVTFNDLELRWPLFCVMLPNMVMSLILHYFTKFVYDVVVKQLLGLPRFQNLLLIVFDHINTICTIIQRLFRQNTL